MNSSRAIPVLLVAALAASGIFVWLSNSEGASREVAQVSTQTAPQPAEGDGGPLARPSVLAEEGATRPSAVERRAAVPRLDETEPPAAAREEASARVVTGRVVDRDGRGVQGATVLASNHLGISLNVELGNGWGSRTTATTDSEGRFELVGLEPGELNLGARKGGFAPFDRSDITLPDDERIELDPIVMSVGAILSGHVLAADGRGVEGAELIDVSDSSSGGLVFFGGRRDPIAVTEADGSFRIDQLACGEWSVRVETEDFPDKTFRGLAERPGQVVGGLEFELDPGLAISGRATDVPASERGALSIVATKQSENWLESFRGRSADVAPDGTFEIRGLSADTKYELQLRSGERSGMIGAFNRRSRSEAVVAWSGDTGVRVPYQVEGALSFQLVDAATGRPITEFRVSAGIDWPVPLRGDDGRVKTHHPEGRARVGDLRPSSSTESVELVIEATGYESYRKDGIAVSAGQELELGAIFLEPVPVVVVTVLDRKSGDPIQGALVSLERAQEPGSMSFERRVEIDSDDEGDVRISSADVEARTDENGVATLTSLEGALCTLEVKSEQHAPWVEEMLRLPVGDSVERTVRLGLGGEVLVTVVDPDGIPQAGTSVAHQAGTGKDGVRMGFPGMPGRARHVTDSEGRVRFERLEAGTHGFKIEDGSGGGVFFGGGAIAVQANGPPAEDEYTRVTVAEGEVTELTLQGKAKAGLSGRILEAGKLLTGATVSLEELGGADDELRMFRQLGGGGLPSTKTDGEGTYRLDGVDEGEYTLRIEHPTRRMPANYDVELRRGSNTFDIDLPLSIVEGRITLSDGSPLAGVTVSAARFTEEGEQRRQVFAIAIEDDGGGGGVVTSGDLGGKSTTTDADGRFTLRGVSPETELVVSCEGAAVQAGRSEPFVVEANETLRGIDVQLEPAGSLAVEVLGADGSAASFVMVEANFADEDAGVGAEREFAQSGSVTLTGLRPGRWNVEARSVRGSGDAPAVSGSADVRIGEKAHLTLRLK